ncbi:uncharacterized protein LOC135216635 [Macrobrachium nipponense]|uniref:uncharacterized protein LOC135216635 n=1 Tax=Macrobrachium nipponense TaxID=159736 RepID=UPI0030C85CA7
MAQLPAKGAEDLLLISEELLPSWSFGSFLRGNCFVGLFGGLDNLEMAQVPAEGPEDLLVISEEVLPSWSLGSILQRNSYAGLLGGLSVMLFILFLKHQDKNLACETTVNEELRIPSELDNLQDINLNLEKEVEEVHEKLCDLVEDKAQMATNDDALLQKIQDLEKDLSNVKNSHAEEIRDLAKETKRQLKEAEDTVQALEKENRVLKKINEKTEGLIVKQEEEIRYLNALITTKDLALMNDRQCIEELHKRLKNLEDERKSLSNECEFEKVKTAEEMDKNIHTLEGNLECHLNERRDLMKKMTGEKEQEKGGLHFLRIVDEEVTKLEYLINSTASDLETFRPQMNEEVQGKVLAAMGKARLLIAQKVEQFRGLCQQNIDGPKGEEPAIMDADLAGFWDMVSIQVDNVHHLFKEINVLKTNGWKQDLNTHTTDNVTEAPIKKKPVKVMKKAMKSCSEEQKARDEARKKLLEERRKAMKEAMKANSSTDGVEIHVIEEKMSHLQENLPGQKNNRTKSDEGGPVNGRTEEEKKQKEGHHFLQLVDKEVSGLQDLINNAESDLETFTPQMSEEVQGKILAATGKARLLISQKIEQFRGLCQQNIDGPKGEEPAIIAEDLAGFWDMVFIQVDKVHKLFKEISDLKTNGWKQDLNTYTTNNVTKGPAKRKPAKVTKKPMKSCSEEQKARDEARKKLLEERRRTMKEAMKANGSTDGVEILVVEEKITHLQENLPGQMDERTKSIESAPVNEKNEEVEKQKEGHHFLQLVDKEVSGLKDLINNAESDLETFTPQMSEEVQGKILAATGKARLLISQKIEQFRGLCQQNIDGPKGEEPAIIAEDLAGFWDMVFIQVDNVNELFREIRDLKTNGWKQKQNTKTTNIVTKSPPKGKQVKAMKKALKSCFEEQKARDEARKKLLEEKRKAMKEATKAKQARPDANGGIDGVEILVSKEKITHLQENTTGDKEDERTKGDEGAVGNEKIKEVEKLKEGHQYLQLVDKEVSELQDLINNAESDLETFTPQMSEEVQGKVLAATGKARLLISQKIEQFRGLCQQNIDGPKGEEPTIIAEDLAGFWDMVSIQVDNVHHLFKEINVLKTNGWKEDIYTQTTHNITKGPVKREPVKVTKKTIKSCSEEQKARNEARKKLLEEKRRAMKEAMKGQLDENGSKEGVEILVAKNKMTHLQEN